MTVCSKLLALAMGLPVLAAAADSDMLNLVMPEATYVMEINLARIVTSPFGAAMGDAIRQGAATQLKAQLAAAKPEIQDQIAGLSNVNWMADVKDVLIAGGIGKGAPTLLIVRSSLDLSRLKALKAFTGDAAEYEGVPLLVSSKAGSGVIAFLGDSLLLAGQMADVQSAIHRRGNHTALSPALAAEVEKYRQDDIWVATTGTLPAPPTPTGAAAKAPMALQVTQYLGKIAGFNGGLRFSPDFDLTFDVATRTVKDATEMSEGLKFITASIQSQSKASGKTGSGLEGLKYQVDGKRILLSLHVPEAQMRAGIQQMRATQAAQASRPATTPQVPRSSGSAPPVPAGSIRVQSSEGTVLIPLDKQP